MILLGEYSFFQEKGALCINLSDKVVLYGVYPIVKNFSFESDLNGAIFKFADGVKQKGVRDGFTGQADTGKMLFCFQDFHD
jgi:hypothetical protein